MTFIMMQHADLDDGADLLAWAATHDLALERRRPDLGARIQQLNPAALDGLVVLGGPQTVDDDLPWLAAERILIRSLIKLGRPVVGLGLGAEQIVRALGAAVPAGDPVTGRQLATLGDGDVLPVFTWQAATMTALPGSHDLLSLAGAPVAFNYHRRVLGVQPRLDWGQQTQQAQLAAGSSHQQALDAAETAAAQRQLATWLAATIL